MKQKTNISQKMRLVAAILYAVLCAYQLFSLRLILSSFQTMSTYFGGLMSVASMPAAWVAELLLAVVAGGMAVWMFAGKTPLAPAVRRAVLMATALSIVFEFISFSAQTEIYTYMLANTFPSLASNTILPVVFLLVRLFLLIVAAFFASSASAEMDASRAKKEAELSENDATLVGDAETGTEVVEEEVVLVEDGDSSAAEKTDKEL